MNNPFELQGRQLPDTAHSLEVDGIYYNVSGNEATVTSCANKYTGDVAIPKTVTYKGTTYTVTSIGGGAFEGCGELTSVTIGNSVKSIGESAFTGCNGLTSVTIPNSVSYIGWDAFSDCSGLTSVTIPNSVTYIAQGAFSACSELTSIQVEFGNPTYDSRDNCNAIIDTAAHTIIAGCMNTTIPNSVTTIGDRAFCGCSGLTGVTIPNSVAAIGESAFSRCSGLMSVTIPNSVTTIRNYAFYRCSDLASVSIGNSVTTIGEEAFYGCCGLTSIQVGRGNPTYDSRDNCNAIIETATNTLIAGCMNTTIPNTVITIGVRAFIVCRSLTSVSIPNSVTSISKGAFFGCSGLTSITVESGNPTYDSRENCNAIIETATNTLITGCMNTTIPKSVTTIGAFAFCGGSGLTDVTIPNSVTIIGDFAFCECSGLTSIDIPNSVTSIGRDAFSGCNELSSATIPNSVTSIGIYAFSGCSGLNDVFSYIEDPTTVSVSVGRAFYQNPSKYAGRTLHVPVGTVSAYQADTKWSYHFGSIVEIEEARPEQPQ